jgi:DNA-binding NarL/FixJ family response regulator
MDIRMPRVIGLDATTAICADPSPAGTRVLILTTFETDEYVARALRGGAGGFLGKDVSADAMLDGIRTIAVSPLTVRTHIQRAMTKLHARTAPSSSSSRTGPAWSDRDHSRRGDELFRRRLAKLG